MVIRTLMIGCHGKMGKEIEKEIEQNPHFEWIGGVHSTTPRAKISSLIPKADLVIDCSHPTALNRYLALAISHQKPVVIGTTGHPSEDWLEIKQAANTLPIFYDSNFSLGIALCHSILRQVARIFPAEQIDVIDTHHAQKKDAPSGTAISLVHTVSAATPTAVHTHSLRTGGVVGTHQVLFSTKEEQIEISHRTFHRTAFAKGALVAAQFLMEQSSGLYSMQDLLQQNPAFSFDV